MKQTKIIMGMPITIEVVDSSSTVKDLRDVFNYLHLVDQKFSPFKKNSEVSRMNANNFSDKKTSLEMKKVILLCKKTKDETEGYFNAYHDGKFDPSGIVKGWAIKKSSMLLKEKGFKDFYIEAGGDIQVSGRNRKGKRWTVGIRNPFNVKEIVKAVFLTNEGIATSGEYERGRHIYNPHSRKIQRDIVSITVIGPDVLEADRFATAAFAMGKRGILFLEKQKKLQSFMIDKDGIATSTSGFDKYTTLQT